MTAAFDAGESAVLPEWIDANGHMNLAYYVVLFDRAADALFEVVGFGAAYREASGCGPFATETHTLYEQELLAGERVRVSCLALASDAKRLHIAYEMHRQPDGARCAAQEVMYLNVDLAARRVAPFPQTLKESLADVVRRHAAAAPDWIGRRIAMPAAYPG